MCRVFSGFVCFDDLRFDARREEICCCLGPQPSLLLSPDLPPGSTHGLAGKVTRSVVVATFTLSHHVRVSAGIVSGEE